MSQEIKLAYGRKGTKLAHREIITLRVGDKLSTTVPLAIKPSRGSASKIRIPAGSIGVIAEIDGHYARIRFPGCGADTFGTTFGGAHANIFEIL